MADPRSCPLEEMIAAVIDLVRSGLVGKRARGVGELVW